MARQPIKTAPDLPWKILPVLAFDFERQIAYRQGDRIFSPLDALVRATSGTACHGTKCQASVHR